MHVVILYCYMPGRFLAFDVYLTCLDSMHCLCQERASTDEGTAAIMFVELFLA
jgi:hypothetical protein